MQTVTLQMLFDPKFAGQRKQFFEYDEEGNVLSIYTAQAAASGGEECIKQVFAYTTVSGNTKLEKSTFQPATWSGTEWDVT